MCYITHKKRYNVSLFEGPSLQTLGFFYVTFKMYIIILLMYIIKSKNSRASAREFLDLIKHVLSVLNSFKNDPLLVVFAFSLLIRMTILNKIQ